MEQRLPELQGPETIDASAHPRAADLSGRGETEQGIDAEKVDAQQRLDQELTKNTRQAQEIQVDFAHDISKREIELKAREDNVLSREEAVEQSQNAVRAQEELIAAERARLAAMEMHLEKRSKEIQLREISLRAQLEQFALKQDEAQEHQHVKRVVQDTVDSIVEQVTKCLGDLDASQPVPPEIIQPSVPDGKTHATDKILQVGAEVTDGWVCEDSLQNTSDAVGLDGLATAASSAEMTSAVGDASENQAECRTEMIAECGQTFQTAQEEDWGCACEAERSSKSVVSDTAQDYNSVTVAAECQPTYREERNSVETLSSTSVVDAEVELLVDEPSHPERCEEKQTANTEMPLPYSDMDLGGELVLETTTMMQAQTDESRNKLHPEDNDVGDTLYTIDEFEEAMNQQRELDEAEEQHKGAYGETRAAANEPPR